MNTVQACGLIKKYKSKIAVNGVDLAVKDGEIFALLGVNGAGKTTLIRMFSCLSKPSGGECFVCGNNCLSQREQVTKIVGLSPQDTAVAENLTVTENLKLICGIYGYSKEKSESEICEMIRLFRMDEVKNSRAKTLSGGWKRKLSIAMALISKPKILFLDEPTLGLDVLARRELWGVVEQLKGSITIILTTHYMEEAERLADRIAIMLNGKIAASGTLSELETLSGKTGLEETFVELAERFGKEKCK